MVTPGGQRMSVAMTNCGDAGWITDRRGYRYDPDRSRQRAALAGDAGGLPRWRCTQRPQPDTRASPDACLINCYEPGARLTLHQDKNERDLSAPIVSVSLGLPAKFLFGGLARSDHPLRVRMEHGDIAVWGGPSRWPITASTS